MVKTALILADDATGLQQVYGIPAVRRLVMITRLLGFDRTLVIGRDPRLRSAVTDLIGDDSFLPLENESDASRVIEKLSFDAEEESVLVLKAGHVIDRWSLARLLQAGYDREISFLKEDGKGSAEAIFFLKAPRLLPLLTSLRSPNETETFLFKTDAVHVKAGPGLPVLLDGTGKRVHVAEAALSATVGEATWGRDSFLYRHASRHISRLMSPGFARMGMTANMVTVLATIIGLAGAFLLSLGGYLFEVAGSLLFLFSTIVDLADGEVARLKLEESSFGHYFDIICDNVVHVAVFSGIALGLYHDTANILYLHLLWFFFGGLALCGFLLNRIISGDPTRPEPSRLAVRLEALLNNRDFAYLVIVLALFNRLDWFFVGSAFGSYLLAGILVVAKFVSQPRRHSDVTPV